MMMVTSLLQKGHKLGHAIIWYSRPSILSSGSPQFSKSEMITTENDFENKSYTTTEIWENSITEGSTMVSTEKNSSMANDKKIIPVIFISILVAFALIIGVVIYKKLTKKKRKVTRIIPDKEENDRVEKVESYIEITGVLLPRQQSCVSLSDFLYENPQPQMGCIAEDKESNIPEYLEITEDSHCNDRESISFLEYSNVNEINYNKLNDRMGNISNNLQSTKPSLTYKEETQYENTYQQEFLYQNMLY